MLEFCMPPVNSLLCIMPHFFVNLLCFEDLLTLLDSVFMTFVVDDIEALRRITFEELDSGYRFCLFELLGGLCLLRLALPLGFEAAGFSSIFNLLFDVCALSILTP